MIELRRRSPLGFLYGWHRDDSPEVTSLCALFWGALFGAIAGVMIVAVSILIAPIYGAYWLWGALLNLVDPPFALRRFGFSLRRITFASLAGAAGLTPLVLMYSEIGWSGLVVLITVLVAVLLLAGGIAFLGVLAQEAIKSWRAGRKPSLVALRWQAWKERVCPAVRLT